MAEAGRGVGQLGEDHQFEPDGNMPPLLMCSPFSLVRSLPCQNHHTLGPREPGFCGTGLFESDGEEYDEDGDRYLYN